MQCAPWLLRESVGLQSLPSRKVMRRSCGLKSSGAGRTMASSSSETSLHFSLRAWWLTTMSTTCCRLLENTCRGKQLTA